MDSERSNAIKEKGAAMRLRLSDKWQDLRERMHHKHRFVVMDTDTFQEKFSIELTGVNLFTYAGISIIVLIVLTSLLIAFTPLRALVPGYIKPELKEQSIRNSQIIDSLEVIIDQHEQHQNHPERPERQHPLHPRRSFRRGGVRRSHHLSTLQGRLAAAQEDRRPREETEEVR